jgi:hypothetical protein
MAESAYSFVAPEPDCTQCDSGDHIRCGNWYDGCCCHNAGPQEFGECPGTGGCSCTSGKHAESKPA